MLDFFARLKRHGWQRLPDECDIVPPAAPLADPSGLSKTQFISFSVLAATVSLVSRLGDKESAGLMPTPLLDSRGTDDPLFGLPPWSPSAPLLRGEAH